jgi:hypothetical protein
MTMQGSTGKSWWQYSVWTKNIARNSRITEPSASVSPDMLAFIKSFVKAMYNPVTSTGTRPWLKEKFQRLSVNSNYQGDIDTEPTHVLIKMLEVVGRDFKKIPITEFEAAGVDILIGLASHREAGTGPYYGGVISSAVVVPPSEPT